MVAEVALSLLLLIGAGLMIRTFISFQRVNPGFRTDNLLTMKLALPFKKYPKPQQQVAFYQQVIERVRALPGVQGSRGQRPAAGRRRRFYLHHRRPRVRLGSG